MYPDHFDDPETRNAVLTYVGKQVAEAARRSGSTGKVRIYPVCALKAWKAQQDGDLEAFRASGVALLRRHLEQFLSESASQQVLSDAAQRIEHAANLAKNDAAVRLRLLDDHDQLASMRAEMDAHVAELEKEFDTEVATRLSEVEQLRKRARNQILQELRDGRLAAEECRTIDDIEAFAAKFSRRMEVQAEQASRMFQQGFDTIVSELRHHLEQRFAAVMSDFTGTGSTMRLSHNMLVLDPARLAQEKRRADQSSRTKIGSAAVGSVAAGGVLTVAATVLGPIGLIAGAVAGYKLGDALGAGRAFQQTLDLVLRNIEQIGVSVTHEFDDQVAMQLDRVRAAVQNQRRSFATDMYQQFNIVERLSSDPAALAKFRDDTNEFIALFDRCGQLAWEAIGQRR